MTNRDIPFAYHADWEAPGRWGVELLTCSHRYILRPMEALSAIPRGSVEAHPIELDDDLDHQFKPGLFCQCAAFLSYQNAKSVHLCSLMSKLMPFRSIHTLVVTLIK